FRRAFFRTDFVARAELAGPVSQNRNGNLEQASPGQGPEGGDAHWSRQGDRRCDILSEPPRERLDDEEELQPQRAQPRAASQRLARCGNSQASSPAAAE